MPDLSTLDFLNANSQREFPLKEGVNRTSMDGLLVLPDDFLVDLLLSVSAGPDLRAYVSRIVNLPGTVQVEISAVSATAPAPLIGRFLVQAATHVRYAAYPLVPGDGFAGAAGKLVVDSLAGLQQLAIGDHVFAPEATELEMRTVIPLPPQVNRLVFRNADGTEFSLTGNVVLQAGVNLRFRSVADASGRPSAVLDAGEGLGLNSPCADDRPAIKTINGVGPDPDGKFWFTASNCAQLTPVSGLRPGLHLADTCCQPCLGCTEVGELTQRVMQLESDLVSLRDNYQQIDLAARQVTALAGSDCACT
jgi:hypothetical protein